MESEFEVILYYKYVQINDPQAFMLKQRRLCESLNLKGRIIIAKEGINGTLEGKKSNIYTYCEEMKSMPEFSDMAVKHSAGNGQAFPKLSVKVRDEIVTSGFGTLQSTEKRITGKHISPETLKEWIKSARRFYIVDMRNDFEQRSGYFKGSILSGIDNFRDLPKFLPKIEHLKKEEVLTVCTGGVRCEKASGYLLENGFENVYQLDGGMHKYMEKYPNEDFLGKLYVFDGRILVGFNTEDVKHEIVGRCEHCMVQSEQYINCSYNGCHRHYITCKDCYRKNRGYCKLVCRLKDTPFLRVFLKAA